MTFAIRTTHPPMPFAVPGDILKSGLSSDAVALLVHFCDLSRGEDRDMPGHFSFPGCIPEMYAETALQELLDCGIVFEVGE